MFYAINKILLHIVVIIVNSPGYIMNNIKMCSINEAIFCNFHFLVNNFPFYLTENYPNLQSLGKALL